MSRRADQWARYGTQAAALTRSVWLSGVSATVFVGLLCLVNFDLVALIPELGCRFLEQTGIPCPFCGLTRSVLSMYRLDVEAAFLYHPFGVLLVGAIFADSSLLFLSGVREAASRWMERNGRSCASAVTFVSGFFVLYTLGRMLWAYLT